MIRLLRWILTGDGHLHKWVKIKEVASFWNASDPLPMYTKHVCRCEICGEIKGFKV